MAQASARRGVSTFAGPRWGRRFRLPTEVSTFAGLRAPVRCVWWGRRFRLPTAELKFAGVLTNQIPPRQYPALQLSDCFAEDNQVRESLEQHWRQGDLLDPPRQARPDGERQAYGSPPQTRPQTALDIIPGNRRNSPAVDFLKSPADLGSPHLLCILIHLGVQARQKGVSQCGPGCGRKIERLLQKIASISRHMP